MEALLKKTRLLGLLILFISIVSTFFYPVSSYAAISVSMTPPSEELQRQQDYDFTVGINTGGATVTSQRAEVTYETQYLELVSVSNGDFFDSVTHTTPSSGKIHLTGTSAAGKSGSGTFAVVRFKLIATSAGSTTLCAATVLTDETPTPTVPTTITTTPTPGNSCGETCSSEIPCATGLICVTSGSQSICAMPQYQSQCAANMSATNCCQAPATAIPQAGSATGWKVGALVALSLISVGVVGMLLL